MAHGALVAGHLQRGTLVAPLPQRVKLPQALRLWSARPLRAGQPVDRVARALGAS
jgi:LysR family glycine cleavage system transcriptional activator